MDCQIKPPHKNSVTVGPTTWDQVAEVISRGAKRVMFRLDWEDHDRYGFLYKGWIFVDYVSYHEHKEHGSEAVYYNRHHLTVRKGIL